MNMLLDLSRLRGGAGRIDRHDPPDAFESTDQDFRVVVPVTFQADVRKDREKVRIVGRLATELEVPCSRCLEPYRIAVDVPVDLLFLPLAAQAAGAPEDRQLGEEDANVSFYEDEAIDLGQVMREQFYLALPMKPLCREDCLGLCPVCGTNRNTSMCSCQPEWVDPRMDGLRQFREKQSKH